MGTKEARRVVTAGNSKQNKINPGSVMDCCGIKPLWFNCGFLSLAFSISLLFSYSFTSLQGCSFPFPRIKPKVENEEAYRRVLNRTPGFAARSFCVVREQAPSTVRPRPGPASRAIVWPSSSVLSPIFLLVFLFWALFAYKYSLA